MSGLREGARPGSRCRAAGLLSPASACSAPAAAGRRLLGPRLRCGASHLLLGPGLAGRVAGLPAEVRAGGGRAAAPADQGQGQNSGFGGNGGNLPESGRAVLAHRAALGWPDSRGRCRLISDNSPGAGSPRRRCGGTLPAVDAGRFLKFPAGLGTRAWDEQRILAQVAWRELQGST